MKHLVSKIKISIILYENLLYPTGFIRKVLEASKLIERKLLTAYLEKIQLQKFTYESLIFKNS